ncbi:Dual specificity protein phosphatase [Verrucomicrobia bacterium]|nr:Dual specificity protein phosphatase [Verrucomicrobiota bacterium]
MSYLNTLIGVLLIAVGLFEGGWVVLAIWLGGDFLVLGIAHAVGAHGVFGKRPDGSLPLWSWVAFLPLLINTYVIWHLIQLFSREAVKHAVTDQLVVGRRLLASELDEDFDNYVDLTAEFSEPRAIRRCAAYRSFPILDAGAPTPAALAEEVACLRPGKTFIHCAQGHGRTGLFALAILLKSGKARTPEEGLRMLQKARRGIRLNRAQRRCVEAFAQNLAVK